MQDRSCKEGVTIRHRVGVQVELDLEEMERFFNTDQIRQEVQRDVELFRKCRGIGSHL